MKRTRFTEAQIAFVLKQAEAGVPVDLAVDCRMVAAKAVGNLPDALFLAHYHINRSAVIKGQVAVMSCHTKNSF
jgi:hypothetical protein